MRSKIEEVEHGKRMAYRIPLEKSWTVNKFYVESMWPGETFVYQNYMPNRQPCKIRSIGTFGSTIEAGSALIRCADPASRTWLNAPHSRVHVVLFASLRSHPPRPAARPPSSHSREIPNDREITAHLYQFTDCSL